MQVHELPHNVSREQSTPDDEYSQRAMGLGIINEGTRSLRAHTVGGPG